MEAERHRVGDGLFSLKGTDLEADALGRVTKSEPLPLAHQRAELSTCNPGNSYPVVLGYSGPLGTICIGCLVLFSLLAEMFKSLWA